MQGYSVAGVLPGFGFVGMAVNAGRIEDARATFMRIYPAAFEVQVAKHRRLA